MTEVTLQDWLLEARSRAALEVVEHTDMVGRNIGVQVWVRNVLSLSTGPGFTREPFCNETLVVPTVISFYIPL